MSDVAEEEVQPEPEKTRELVADEALKVLLRFSRFAIGPLMLRGSGSGGPSLV